MARPKPASPSPAASQAARTELPNPRQVPRYAGVATFCRFPQIERVADHHQPVDWAVYGAPYDLGVTYRPGARFGPRAVRAESQYIKPAHLEHGVNIAQVFSLADAGDAPVGSFDPQVALDGIVDFAMNVGRPSHTRLLAVGGDHSIAYANMKATWQRRGKPANGLALLHFDAHLDTVDAISASKWTHGSVFRRAIEEGIIDPKRMLSVGIRGPLNSLDDLVYGRSQGVRIVTLDKWRGPEGSGLVHEFLARLNNDETYLTFDIDCVDPAFAPGTGTPCCGGFAAAEILDLLRGCAAANLVGADVVEVLPDRDVAGITALLASHVIFEILAASAAHVTRSV